MFSPSSAGSRRRSPDHSELIFRTLVFFNDNVLILLLQKSGKDFDGASVKYTSSNIVQRTGVVLCLSEPRNPMERLVNRSRPKILLHLNHRLYYSPMNYSSTAIFTNHEDWESSFINLQAHVRRDHIKLEEVPLPQTSQELRIGL